MFSQHCSIKGESDAILINDTSTCINYIFYIVDSDSDSDIIFNIHVDIYITQQNNSLLDK